METNEEKAIRKAKDSELRAPISAERKGDDLVLTLKNAFTVRGVPVKKAASRNNVIATSGGFFSQVGVIRASVVAIRRRDTFPDQDSQEQEAS